MFENPGVRSCPPLPTSMHIPIPSSYTLQVSTFYVKLFKKGPIIDFKISPYSFINVGYLLLFNKLLIVGLTINRVINTLCNILKPI